MHKYMKVTCPLTSSCIYTHWQACSSNHSQTLTQMCVFRHVHFLAHSQTGSFECVHTQNLCIITCNSPLKKDTDNYAD